MREEDPIQGQDNILIALDINIIITMIMEDSKTEEIITIMTEVRKIGENFLITAETNIAIKIEKVFSLSFKFIGDSHTPTRYFHHSHH